MSAFGINLNGATERYTTMDQLGEAHLNINQQSEQRAMRLARCLVHPRNRTARLRLIGAKLVDNAVSLMFRGQTPSNCGTTFKKSWSTHSHVCCYGFELVQDLNTTVNSPKMIFSIVRQTDTLGSLPRNASEDLSMAAVDGHQPQRNQSLKEEPCYFVVWDCQL